MSEGLEFLAKVPIAAAYRDLAEPDIEDGFKL
jgi:hypothetical protein